MVTLHRLIIQTCSRTRPAFASSRKNADTLTKKELFHQFLLSFPPLRWQHRSILEAIGSRVFEQLLFLAQAVRIPIRCCHLLLLDNGVRFGKKCVGEMNPFAEVRSFLFRIVLYTSMRKERNGMNETKQKIYTQNKNGVVNSKRIKNTF
ncbi:hypothetical protein CDAR_230701 [Caerostris darwini]|uniref:Uncharacterized protein n=1 Tax=Caerostris darwini TaxID=1538125 RepID=A0AAV4S6F2_9ARAC|nr:hypothetical protein CDAR_230701 [Caerostris darwini]